MKEISQNMFEQQAENTFSEQQIRNALKTIYDLAAREVSAEGNTSSKMLSTEPIREIVSDCLSAIPQIVVIGAKGSGKTYVYKQMMAKQTWGSFLKIINKEEDSEMEQALILPLLESINSRYLQTLTQNCFQKVEEALPDFSIHPCIASDNFETVVNGPDSDSTWSELWRSTLLQTIGGGFHSLEQVDAYLHEKGGKIIFLVDGLDDLVTSLQVKPNCNWKSAIRAITQNLINELRTLPYNTIGIIVFVRKDIAEEAIPVNFAQFMNQYQRYELVWTPTEALRLALWIGAQAVPDILGANIDILRASREALESKLELLWGKRLGKKDSREPISARWIIAALSDCTGQLLARDIVLFLKYAAKTYSDMSIRYPDRYIMPTEIRKAISECSKDKYGEIKMK